MFFVNLVPINQSLQNSMLLQTTQILPNYLVQVFLLKQFSAKPYKKTTQRRNKSADLLRAMVWKQRHHFYSIAERSGSTAFTDRKSKLALNSKFVWNKEEIQLRLPSAAFLLEDVIKHLTLLSWMNFTHFAVQLKL